MFEISGPGRLGGIFGPGEFQDLVGPARENFELKSTVPVAATDGLKWFLCYFIAIIPHVWDQHHEDRKAIFKQSSRGGQKKFHA